MWGVFLIGLAVAKALAEESILETYPGFHKVLIGAEEAPTPVRFIQEHWSPLASLKKFGKGALDVGKQTGKGLLNAGAQSLIGEITGVTPPPPSTPAPLGVKADVLSLFRRIETEPPKPDLEEMKKLNAKLAELYAQIKSKSEKIKKNADLLRSISQASTKKGLKMVAQVLDEDDIEMAEAEAEMKKINEKTAVFSSGVFIMLPDPPSVVEEIEFFKALQCQKYANASDTDAKMRALIKKSAAIEATTDETLADELKEAQIALQTATSRRMTTLEEMRTAIKNKSWHQIPYLKLNLKMTLQMAQSLTNKINKIKALMRNKNALAHKSSEERESELEADSANEENEAEPEED